LQHTHIIQVLCLSPKITTQAPWLKPYRIAALEFEFLFKYLAINVSMLPHLRVTTLKMILLSSILHLPTPMHTLHMPQPLVSPHCKHAAPTHTRAYATYCPSNSLDSKHAAPIHINVHTTFRTALTPQLPHTLSSCSLSMLHLPHTLSTLKLPHTLNCFTPLPSSHPAIRGTVQAAAAQSL
jgi:hypothetical protein